MRVQRCEDSAHSRARTRSLSLALSPSCFLLRALSLPPSSPLSLNSRTHRHPFLLALLSLSPSPSPSLSLFLSLSLSPLFYRLLSHSLSLARALPILAHAPVYMSPRHILTHTSSSLSRPGGGRRRVKGSEQRADLCTGLYYRPYRGCQQQRRRAPLGRTFAAG